MTPDEANDIANRVAELREACNTCRSVWQSQQVYLSAETRGAVNGALNNSAGRINKIDKDAGRSDAIYMQLVSRCAVEHDLYSGPGNLFKAMETSAFSFSRFWDEVVAPTAKEIVVTAKDTVDNANNSLPFVAIGLVAVALIVIFK